MPALAEVASKLETVRHFVVMGDPPSGGGAGSLPNALSYQELLDDHGGFDYPELDERQAAGLCYTSGTTGNPKGVLYSHRSTLLQALGSCMADGAGVCASDRVLPVVPMFHANAWATAHASGLTGADLVMPGPYLQGEPLAKLIESEKVTVAADVPTMGETTGELQASGPWIARRYYGDDTSDEKFDRGWLHTGDVASIDAQRIIDRTIEEVPKTSVGKFDKKVLRQRLEAGELRVGAAVGE